MMLSTGLSDIGYNGSNFTWSNNCQGFAYVAARLDRILLKHLWLEQYNNPSLLYLAIFSLGHNPLLPSHTTLYIPKIAPLKFEQMWIQNLNFLRIVKSSWNLDILFLGNPQFVVASPKVEFEDMEQRSLWLSEEQYFPSRRGD